MVTDTIEAGLQTAESEWGSESEKEKQWDSETVGQDGWINKEGKSSKCQMRLVIDCLTRWLTDACWLSMRMRREKSRGGYVGRGNDSAATLVIRNAFTGPVNKLNVCHGKLPASLTVYPGCNWIPFADRYEKESQLRGRWQGGRCHREECWTDRWLHLLRIPSADC